MRFFPLSKISQLRKASSKNVPDVVDIKFPSELKDGDQTEREVLIFIVDDDPGFMQILNTHLLNFSYEKNNVIYRFKVKNYATGGSCLKDLKENPNVLLVNYHINDGLKNVMTGRQLLDTILEADPAQKIVVMNDLEDHLKGIHLAKGLREEIRRDTKALKKLERILQELV